MTRRPAQFVLSKAGATGLAIVIGAIVLFAVIASLPYFWHAAITAQLSESRDLLTLIEAKTRNAANRKGAALTPADDIAPVFAAGGTSGLALAELQRLAGAMAEQNGLVLERTQPLPTEEKDGLAILRMEVETSGSIEGLRGYLHAIETGMPLIFVRRAHISTAPAESESGQSLPSEHLSARLELEAFAWWETPQ
jgi:type II secretion system (T2SS) protein M